MLRSHTLVDDFPYVSRLDPAVDSGAPDFEERWRLYRDGAGDPPLKEGLKPARFILRHLPETEKGWLLENYESGTKGLLMSAAALALVSVTGLDDSEGKPIVVRHEHTPYGMFKLRHASKETLDKLGLPVLVELGQVAVDRMNLRPS